MEDLRQDHLSQMDLQVDNIVRQQFYEAGKWSKFIAIVMFVACGLMLLFGILGGAAIYTALKKFGNYQFITDFDGTLLIAVLVLVVAILAVVYYFLYNFSRKIKRALISDNTTELNEGLKSLKTFFIISTVLSILSLLFSIAKFFY
jgi:hypothetical protein